MGSSGVTLSPNLDQVDLERAIALLEDVIADLDDNVRHIDPDDDLDIARAVQALLNLRAVRAGLETTEGTFEQLIAKRLTKYRTTLPGVGTVIRRGKASRKCIDEEGIWRLVLDTRVVDEATGEVLPQLEVVKRAYGSVSKETGVLRLTGVTPGKVEALGIENTDEFFESVPVDPETGKKQYEAYSLEVKR
jgi:hypothetical protein